MTGRKYYFKGHSVKRMTGHNIIIMTIIAHFSSFLEAGAVDDNNHEWKYWAPRFRKSKYKECCILSFLCYELCSKYNIVLRYELKFYWLLFSFWIILFLVPNMSCHFRRNAETSKETLKMNLGLLCFGSVN